MYCKYVRHRQPQTTLRRRSCKCTSGHNTKAKHVFYFWFQFLNEKDLFFSWMLSSKSWFLPWRMCRIFLVFRKTTEKVADCLFVLGKLWVWPVWSKFRKRLFSGCGCSTALWHPATGLLWCYWKCSFLISGFRTTLSRFRELLHTKSVHEGTRQLEPTHLQPARTRLWPDGEGVWWLQLDI